MTAATVKPAAVEPTPVVRTDRGTILETKRRSSDLPVPGSPTSNRWDSDLVHTPVNVVSSTWQPPAKTVAMANFTRYKPYI